MEMHDSHRARARVRAALEVDAVEQDTAAARIGARLFGAAAPGASAGVFGPYVLLAAIGAGAHGVVWCAFHPPTRRKVALKVLAAGTDHADAIAEARALGRVNHPNVVTVFDAGTDRGRSYIAMEWVAGRTLAAWLEPGRPRREILAAFAAAARGLHAAHAVGIVHRDFKPANVLVGDDGRVRVGDFGLALGGGDDDQGRPIHAGTPVYMAPEQHAGARADARSDQFAFFVALSEALVGVRPFAGHDHVALRAAILAEDRQVGAGLPAWLRRGLDRGLAAEPSRRFDDLAQVATWLERVSSRRRGRLPWVVVAGSFVALAAGLGEGGSPRCEGPIEATTRLWPSDRRDEVVTRVEAAAPPAMAGVGARVGQGLDRWIARWSEIQHAQCMAHDAGEADDAMMCLRAQQREFIALGRVLADADGTIAQHAVDAVTRLGEPEHCTTAAAHAVPVTEPVAAALAEVAALRHAGKPGLALALAEVTLDEARGRAAAIDVAAAEVAVGRAAEEAGEIELAVASLRAGFADGYALRADRLASAAATRLVYLEGYLLERDAHGEHWHRAAASLGALDAAAGRDSPEAADLLANVGAMAEARGDGDEALARSTAALRMRERLFDAPHPEIARAHNNIGVVLVGLGRFDGAIAAHREALDQRVALYGEQHPAVATSRHNLGFVYLRLGDAVQAERELTAALEIRVATLGATHPDVASSLAATATVSAARGDTVAAIGALTRAVSISEHVWGVAHERTTGLRARVEQLRSGGHELGAQ